MTADRLRRVAAEMREKAEAATPGVWCVVNMDDGSSEPLNAEGGWWWVWASDRMPYYGGVLEPESHTGDCRGDSTCCRKVVGAAAITDGSQPAQERADAAHIAAWHPAVALAVADWLDASADGLDAIGYSLAVCDAWEGK